MFTFEDERTHFNFSGTYEGYTIVGNCIFSNNKLIDVNATISEPAENPETEGEMVDLCTFNYGGYLEDRANYSYYVPYDKVEEFSSLIPAIVNYIEQSRESLS